MFQRLVGAASIFPMVTATGWISVISPGVNEEVYDSSRTTLPEPTRFQFREGAGEKTNDILSPEKKFSHSSEKKWKKYPNFDAARVWKINL